MRAISAFDALKEYSYRPFSGDRDSRTIDPRTYFVFRHFLDESKASGKDVALPTTWVNLRSIFPVPTFIDQLYIYITLVDEN